MKTNLILKTVVVAMAAFGAYAFSGSSKDSHQYTTFDSDIQDCTNIVLAECDNSGSETCRIDFNGKVMDIYDITCTYAIKHNSADPVNWL